MKFLHLLVCILLLYVQANSEIVNAHQRELAKAWKSLNNLQVVLADIDQQDSQYTEVRSRIYAIRRQIKILERKCRETGELLRILQKRHPELYRELEHITNRILVSTDVYVQALQKEEMEKGLMGTTNLQQSEHNPHTYVSPYGHNTVLVSVRKLSASKSLELLVHELAHVKYQVPNLKEYMKYFRKHYLEYRSGHSFGHQPNDPSNRMVIEELQRFRKLARFKSR